MHGTSMVFLAVMPLSAAFFNYMIPLMIGARDVAFPRLNALSYWVFLLGGLFLNASWFVGAAPDAGWFGYAPLTTKPFSLGPNSDFWLFGLIFLGTSSILGVAQLPGDDPQPARAGDDASSGSPSSSGRRSSRTSSSSSPSRRSRSP